MVSVPVGSITDHFSENLRAALERHAQQLKEKGKQQTAEDTVDRLLDRF